MQKNRALDEKVREVSLFISTLEKKIAEAETNDDGESIKEKMYLLRRKLGLFRQLLSRYSSPSFNYRLSAN